MKYIIDIPDELAEATTKYWNATLVPYTEPDQKAIEDEVWEFASMLINMHPDVAESIYWSMNGGKGIGVAAEMTYQEAKSKYDAWKKQKEQIHVRDEVVDKDGQKGIATFVYNGGRLFDVLWDDGSVTEDADAKDFLKTGRHFPELEQLLKKVKENTSNDS